MKYPANARVQFTTENLGVNSGSRYVYYRIYPKDLSIFKRWFHNPWRKMYHAFDYLAGKNSLYSPKEYMKDIAPLKTLSDVYDYLLKQKSIIDNRYKKEVLSGDRWPDEYD